MTPRFSRFEWGCIAVVAAAFVLRLTFLIDPAYIWDSAWFLMLSRAFGETGTFLLRWSDPAAPQYSGYWPPLFPIFATPFTKLLGGDFRAVVLASITASALLTAAVFGTTRDLFGRKPAFAAMAMVAATPAYYVSDAKGMSESLLTLMVVLAAWAFVKSLEKPAYLALAGVFGFLAYLGKASLGLPLVAAVGVAVGGWRVYTRGWRTIARSPIDLGVALAGVAVLAILALTRTERIGGLGVGIIDPLRIALLNANCADFSGIQSVGFHCWAMVYVLKVFFVAAFLLVVTLPFSLRLPQLLRAPRTERTDALWLATLLPLFAGAVFTTSFYFTEHRAIIDFDNIRYLTPAIIPFLWLLLPHWPFEEADAAEGKAIRRRHERWYSIAVAAMVAVLAFNPLTGTETLPRFFALIVLCLIPLTIASVAYATQYVVSERRTPRGIERRYVRGNASPQDRRVALVTLAIVAIGAWFFSSWYATVGLGLVVALAASSPLSRAVGMSFVLLASAAAGAHSPVPVDEAAEAMTRLPEGTLVGMTEIIVYPASVAPDNIEVRFVDPRTTGIPDDINVLLLQPPYLGGVENFTRARSWDYRFAPSPTIAARVWIEEHVVGTHIEFEKVPGIALYVRNGSGLETYLS